MICLPLLRAFLVASAIIATTARPGTVHVADADVVTLPETEFVVTTVGALNKIRVTVLIPVVHIGRAMILEVFSRALHAITKTTLLGLAKLGRSSIPAARSLAVAVGRRRRPAIVLASVILGKGTGACCKNECECCGCETIAGHGALSEDISGESCLIGLSRCQYKPVQREQVLRNVYTGGGLRSANCAWCQ